MTFFLGCAAHEDLPGAEGLLPTDQWEEGKTWSVRQTAWPERYHHPEVVSDTPVETTVRYEVRPRDRGHELIWTWEEEHRSLRMQNGFRPHSIWRLEAGGRPVERMHVPVYQRGLMVFDPEPAEPLHIVIPTCGWTATQTVYPLERRRGTPVLIDCSRDEDGVWEVHRGADRWVLRREEGDPWWREVRWFHRERLVQRQVLVDPEK